MYLIYDVQFKSSPSSSIADGCNWPPLPDADDDDKIGPDNCKNDDKMLPEPDDGAAAGAPRSSESSSNSLPGTAGAPPLDKPPKLLKPLKLEPPDNPPKAPVDALLNAPNFVVMAAIFGWITACNNEDSDVIGVGGLMPYCSFLAIFVLSKVSMNLVFASRIPSIFYLCVCMHVYSKQFFFRRVCLGCVNVSPPRLSGYPKGRYTER